MAAITAAACGQRPAAPPPREPPPHVLVVSLGRVALRSNAYVELHALLAAAARSGQSLDDPDLDAAARTYARVMAADDTDEGLARAARALGPCADDRCAAHALAGSRLDVAFAAALPAFLARRWSGRAGSTAKGVAVARAALGVEVVPLMNRLARDLGVTLPDEPVAVDLVTDAPGAGRRALSPVALAVHGACFAARRKEDRRVRRARVVDCVLARAFTELAGASALMSELERHLDRADAQRAFEALVIHAVAATVRAWEPRHESTTRRSASVPEPEVFAWLAEHWRERAAGEDAAAFATRYAEAFREARR